MTLEKFLEIEEKLSDDKLEEVLNSMIRMKAFSSIKTEISVLNARLKGLKNGIIQGTVSFSDSSQERNKIRIALLELSKDTKRLFISEEEEDFYQIRKRINILIIDIENFFETINQRGINGYEWTEESDEDFAKIIKTWNEQSFSVAVIALMKSGKSTLLNAWMGNEFLPANIKPETMRVVRIKHDPRNLEGRLIRRKSTLAKGPEDVRFKLSTLNKKARDKDKLPSSEELTLKIDLPVLKGKRLDDVQFELLDTPGVNEAGVQQLESKVNRLVENSDVIIYLLDISKLKSEDEEKMFKKLQDARAELFKQVRTKLFFVINKVDLIENRNFKEAKGFVGIDDVKKYVITYLQNNLSINLEEDEVFFCSAEKAVLGRVMLSGNASEKQKTDFYNLVYGVKRRRKIPEEYVISDAKEILEESGILSLEDKIIRKIHEKRMRIFVTSMIYKLEKLLDQVKRNIEVSKGSLNKRGIQIEKLKSDIGEINSQLEELSVINSEFKKKGNNSIDNFFHQFKEQVTQNIKSIFSDDKDIKTDNLIPFLADILKRLNYVFTTEDKQKIAEKVDDLHFQVMKSLDSSFRVLWNRVVSHMHRYHEEQVEKINVLIKPLVKRIEDKINEELDIDLKPNDMRFPPLVLNKFYEKIERDVNRLISEKDVFSPRLETETRVANKDVKFLFWTIRKKGDVYEVTRFKMWKKQYSFSSYQYQRYLVNEIKSLSSNTEAIAKQVVEKQFEKFRDEVEAQVTNYSQRYISIIENEIQRKEAGIDIEERKKVVSSDLIALDRMIQTLLGFK